jgi:hypothetical protein
LTGTDADTCDSKYCGNEVDAPWFEYIAPREIIVAAAEVPTIDIVVTVYVLVAIKGEYNTPG